MPRARASSTCCSERAIDRSQNRVSVQPGSPEASCANRSASLVFPAPGGPTIVTSRAPPSNSARRAATSDARPTRAFGSGGSVFDEKERAPRLSEDRARAVRRKGPRTHWRTLARADLTPRPADHASLGRRRRRRRRGCALGLALLVRSKGGDRDRRADDRAQTQEHERATSDRDPESRGPLLGCCLVHCFLRWRRAPMGVESNGGEVRSPGQSSSRSASGAVRNGWRACALRT